jgi:hypothetical protein
MIQAFKMKKTLISACHARKSGHPAGFLLEFTPYLIWGRNDEETRIWAKSTSSRPVLRTPCFQCEGEFNYPSKDETKKELLRSP